MGTDSKPRLPCNASDTYVDEGKVSLHNSGMATELWQRIIYARKQAKLTQDQVAGRLGISRAAVAQWEAKDPGNRTSPTRDNLRDFAELVGAPLGWFYDDADELRPWAGYETPSVAKVLETETATDYVRVEQIDGEAQMGPGRVNDDFPEVIKSVDFTPAYIRAVVGFVPPPGRLKLVTGVGNSMAPKIQPGEVVMVDTGCIEFVGDGLYLINTGAGQQIKALQARPDGIWAHSNDPVFFPPFRLDENSIIGGRVYLIQHLERVA